MKYRRRFSVIFRNSLRLGRSDSLHGVRNGPLVRLMRRRGSTFDHRSRASGDGQRFGAAVLMPTVILWGKVCPLAPPLVIALIYRAVK